ncbi:MAG: GntP family permease [Paludibacter sp.]
MSLITISILVLGAILLIIMLTSVIKLNAFVSLFMVSLLLALIALPGRDVVSLMKDGFGSTMASIGFLIVLGAIIAVTLDMSGGAVSIANYIISKTGKSKAAAALGITGFVAGIPIFCDSGFIILSGLAKSFSSKSKIALPFVSIVLATSLYSVHCLLPTHPGALAAAGILEVNIGNLILMGTLYAIPAALAGFFWVKWRTRNEPLPQDDFIETDLTEEGLKQLPSVGFSLLPIATPLILIALGSLIKVFGFSENNLLVKILSFIGQPVIALLIGAILSVLLIKNKEIKVLNQLFDSAIEKAGPILIITAAGGMFGLVIKETGVGTYFGQLLAETGLGLAVPFLIAVIMKTAQGSSTVAIITAASFVVPMLPYLGLQSETGKLLAMLSMGAGSMMISHANDSYFWVVTRFSGIKLNTTLKVYSTATVIMGVTVFLFTLITSWFIL